MTERSPFADLESAGNPFADLESGTAAMSAEANPFADLESGTEERTIAGTMGDIGVSLAGGTNALLETGGSLYGLATGDMDNWARNQGKSGREYWQDKKSAPLKADEATRRAAIDEADGQVAKFGTAFWETVKNPALLSSFVAEQIPMFTPVGLAGRAGTVASLAAGATKKTAGVIGTGTAIGVGAGLQGADVGGGAYEEILKLPEKLWEQNGDYQSLRINLGDQEAKKKVALDLAQRAGTEGGVASVLTNLLPFARTFERATAGVPTKLTGNFVARGIKGAAGESLQESLEEGLGRVSVNRAVGEVDPSRQWNEGVGEAAGMGAIGGAVMGGGAGALSSPATKGTIKTDTSETGRAPDSTPENIEDVLGGVDVNAPENPFRDLLPDQGGAPQAPVTAPAREAAQVRALPPPRLVGTPDGQIGTEAQVEAQSAAQKTRSADLGMNEVAGAVQGRAAAPEQILPPDESKKPADLLQVIAGAGGLNRAEAKAQGLDPESFKVKHQRAAGAYGKGMNLFPSTGGMSMDSLAELLSQNGFLPEGQYSANEALDLVTRAINQGEKIYSPRAGAAVFEAEAEQRDYEQRLTDRDRMTPEQAQMTAKSIIDAWTENQRKRVAGALGDQAVDSWSPTPADMALTGYNKLSPDAKNLVAIRQEGARIMGDDAFEALFESISMRNPDLEGPAFENTLSESIRRHTDAKKPGVPEVDGRRQSGVPEDGEIGAGPGGGQTGQQTAAEPVQARQEVAATTPDTAPAARQGASAAPSPAVPVAATARSTEDLAGPVDQTAQAVKDADVDRQRKIDASPPMESGAGDLFSGKSKQTEVEDTTGRSDRRKDSAARQRVSEMSPSEMAEALLRDHKTGLYNDRAYAEHDKLPIQVAIDLDSLKWVNDNMGHASGDVMLKAMGEALQRHTEHAYRLGGDEYVVQAENESDAKRIMEAVSETLSAAVVTATRPDGSTITKTGVSFSYGYGKTLQQADGALAESKGQRESQGLRAGRGIDPPGAVKAAPVGDQPAVDQVAEEVTAPKPTHEKQSAEPAPAEKTAANKYASAQGTVVNVKAVNKRGQTVTVKEDAAEALARIDEQESLAQRLLECLSS